MTPPASVLRAILPNIVDGSPKKRNMREKSAPDRDPAIPFLQRRGGVPAPDSSPERRAAPGKAARVSAAGGCSSLPPLGLAQVEFRQGQVLRPGDFDVVGAARHEPRLVALALHGLGFISRHPALRHHRGKTFP